MLFAQFSRHGSVQRSSHEVSRSSTQGSIFDAESSKADNLTQAKVELERATTFEQLDGFANAWKKDADYARREGKPLIIARNAVLAPMAFTLAIGFEIVQAAYYGVRALKDSVDATAVSTEAGILALR